MRNAPLSSRCLSLVLFLSLSLCFVSFALAPAEAGRVGAGKATENRPVGIVNPRDYCYMSSVLQILYHLPPVRREILLNRTADIIHTMLGALFYRLLAADESISLDADIMPAILSLASEEGGLFDPTARDDPAAFLTWLDSYHLGWLLRPLFGVQTETRRYYGDRLMRCEKVSDIITSAKPLDVDGGSVHHCLDEGWAPASAQYKIEEEGLGLPIHQTVFLDTHVRVSVLAPILVISAAKFKYVPNKPNDNWHYDVPTRYERSFTIQSQTYHLYGVVIHAPEHYRTYVCTDPVRDRWHVFDDGAVKEVSSRYNIGGDGYLFVYVHEDTLKTWKDEHEGWIRSPSQVPHEYQQLGQVLGVLHDVTKETARFTGIDLRPCTVELVPALADQYCKPHRLVAI